MTSLQSVNNENKKYL